MAQMVNPWPKGDEVVRLSTRERALRLIDRLEVTRDDPTNSLLRKDWFVNGEVTEWVSEQRRRPGAMTRTSSEEALGAEPELARAWSEAWDFAVRQGWLGDDPERRSFVYLTAEGKEALADYRSRSGGSSAGASSSSRPKVTDGQRAALEEILSVFLERGDWPNHAYLDHELHGRGIDLNKELETLPERLIAPDNRRSAGTVYYADDEKIALMVRGLAACGNVDRYDTLFVAFVRWAVAKNQSLKVDPQERPVREWQAAEAIAAMQDAVGELAPHEAKLIFEVSRWESQLPSWSGLPTGRAEAWTIHVPREIRNLEGVRSLADYLQLTQPNEVERLRVDVPPSVAGLTDPFGAVPMLTGAEVVEEVLAAETRGRAPGEDEPSPKKDDESRGWSFLTKLGVVVGIVASLFGIGFGISKLVDATHHRSNVADSVSSICGSTHAPYKNGRTVLEREWPRTPVNTFRNCHDASGAGKAIAANQFVRVYCRALDPTIKSSKPGWWYRIANPPWNGNFFATANTFLNGDPQFGPYHHPVDLAVPKC